MIIYISFLLSPHKIEMPLQALGSFVSNKELNMFTHIHEQTVMDQCESHLSFLKLKKKKHMEDLMPNLPSMQSL